MKPKKPWSGNEFFRPKKCFARRPLRGGPPKQVTASLSAAIAPDKSIYDPGDFPDRESLIRYLVRACGWPKIKVAKFFERSDRQIRRLTTFEQFCRDQQPDAPEPAMTPEEVREMLRDYEGDPYMTAEDREAARAFILSECPVRAN